MKIKIDASNGLSVRNAPFSVADVIGLVKNEEELDVSAVAQDKHFKFGEIGKNQWILLENSMTHQTNYKEINPTLRDSDPSPDASVLAEFRGFVKKFYDEDAETEEE